MILAAVLKAVEDIRISLSFNKTVFTLDEFCAYTGYKKSYVYKLVSAKQIPYHKRGKSLFFKRVDVIKYITAIRIASKDELNAKAVEQLKQK